MSAFNRKIAILPLGAHEYHGPHLPLETDTLIARAISERLQLAIGDQLETIFLPVEETGYSPEHLDRPGTRSLAYDDAIERWLKVAGDLASAGTGKLVLLNAHGGNSPLLGIVAMEARLRFGMLCVATSWTRFGIPQDIVPADRKVFDIHGGQIETSVMMAIAPHLVRMEQLAEFPSRQQVFSNMFKHLRAYGPHAFGWMMRDLNAQGAAGDARLATAEKGERLIAHAVEGLCELLGDVDAFDLDLFDGHR